VDTTYPACSCCNPLFNHFLLQLLRRKFMQGTATFAAAITGGGAQLGQAQANVAAAITGGGVQSAQAKTASTQNQSQSAAAVADPSPPQPTIYVAQKIITMEASQPEATAVAVAGDTILAVGNLEQVQKKLQALGYSLDESTIDRTFEAKVILPGFVEHHLHPLLGAMTMAVEIIAIEDWTVPGKGTAEAVKDKETYKARLRAAIEQMSADSNVAGDETLFTWGYHHYFHGEFYRTELDEFCQSLNEKDRNRPIVIWHRSCHEFIFNTVALEKYEITEDLISRADEHTQSQASWEDGHFFEKGMELILGNIAGDLLNPNRVQKGLNILRQYLLSKGVTTICEPGTQMNLTIQEVWNEGLNTEDAAFRTYFIPDGRALYDQHKKDRSLGTLIQDTESWLDKGRGKVQWLPGQIKLFADGAIFSQLMQLQDPYLDDHEGQWIAEPEDYKAAFKLYWEAGYQINTHVNGDEGLRVVVETLAENMETYPREDHRFTVVHFAVSTKEQVKALGEMGAIVTANPYYVTALADKYSQEGLGPARAKNMVRLGAVAEAGMVIGLHSDMPMAPADMLFLAWCAANRITPKHKKGVATHQCISVERSLSAVTIEAAYCLGLDNEIGSIKPHKTANFTILEDDPLTVPKKKLKDIPVWGCVFEGTKYPVNPPETIQPKLLKSRLDLKTVNLAQMAASRG